MTTSTTTHPCNDNDVPPVLRAYLLGRFEIWVGATPVTVWGGTKAQVLLKRLLIAHPTPVHAEKLITTLWPDSMDIRDARSGNWEELAHMRLYTTASQLRRALQTACHDAGSWIVANNGAYALRPSDLIWVDVVAFEQLRRDGQFVASRGDTAAAQAIYEKAVALYRGDLFADDPYADWAAPLRTRLQAMHLAMLIDLAQWAFAEEDYPRYINWAEQALSHDGGCEEMHRLLMRCYSRLGQRALALRQYQRCVDALRVEFDALPEAETEALAAQLRRGERI